MLKTDLKGIKIPGYAQMLDVTVSSPSLIFTAAGCQAQYDLSPTTDTTSKLPVSIANGTTTIVDVPDYVKAAHDRFFKESLPGLLASFSKNESKAVSPIATLSDNLTTPVPKSMEANPTIVTPGVVIPN